MSDPITCTLFNVFAIAVNWLLRIKCNSALSGIVLPSGCGKSTMAKSLVPHKKHLKLLDLESAVMLEISKEDQSKLNELKEKNESQTYDAKFQVLARDYVDKLRQDFKKDKFILVSSSYELLKFVGVAPPNIVSFVPSNQFFSVMKKNMDDITGTISELSRQNLIIANKNVNVFSSFEELYSIASSIFKLKAKL